MNEMKSAVIVGTAYPYRGGLAGINQTLHQIIMTITIQITIVTPAGTDLIETSSQVVVAETVIVGTVPNSYLSVDSSGLKTQQE